FVITGKDRDEIERVKGGVRQQIAFYASTRTYIGVLEAHGWGETCYRLNEKAAQGDWSGMASLITDEMLEIYAVQGTFDEVPGLLKKRYSGVIDRLSFLAALRLGYWLAPRTTKKFEKSTPPSILPIGGMRMSLTIELTTVPNAAPMMTPIARSTALPLSANSLKSFSMGVSFTAIPIGCRGPLQPLAA